MKRKINRTPTIGSISHGTLRTEDLLEAFLWELCRVAPRKHGALKREARATLKCLDRGEDVEEYACDLGADLQDALNEHAPPFMYFGNTGGDGSDFGWWPDWGSIDELPQFDDGAPKDFVGEYKSVNDHGNVSVLVRFGNGRVKYLFGIV